MRKFRIVCIAWILLTLLTGLGCQSAPAAPTPADTASPAPITTTVPEAEPTEPLPPADAEAGGESRFAPLYQQMQDLGVLPEMLPLPDTMVTDFYGIDHADYTDGLYYLSYDSLLADEVVLVEATDDAAAKRIEQALENRLSVKAYEAESYAPEQHAVIQRCAVRRNGLSVALIVSPSFEALTELFMQFG